jgi:hypothetical protein
MISAVALVEAGAGIGFERKRVQHHGELVGADRRGPVEGQVAARQIDEASQLVAR